GRSQGCGLLLHVEGAGRRDRQWSGEFARRERVGLDLGYPCGQLEARPERPLIDRSGWLESEIQTQVAKRTLIEGDTLGPRFQIDRRLEERPREFGAEVSSLDGGRGREDAECRPVG